MSTPATPLLSTPPYNLNDMMTEKIVDSSRKLALALGTKGLVNIQYLIWENRELYVIEVNPRASRTVPYISKVTGVPMVDVAARVMLGAPLRSLGYGTGLHPIPPYYAVKVPVFSFEKARRRQRLSSARRCSASARRCRRRCSRV